MSRSCVSDAQNLQNLEPRMEPWVRFRLLFAELVYSECTVDRTLIRLLKNSPRPLQLFVTDPCSNLKAAE